MRLVIFVSSVLLANAINPTIIEIIDPGYAAISLLGTIFGIMDAIEFINKEF